MQDSREYVTVNKGQDLWLIDYDEGVAKLSMSLTVDDLEVNEKTHTDYNGYIGDFLIEGGYLLTKESGTIIWFKKKARRRQVEKMDFAATVMKVGNTGMITVPVSLLGRRVKISLEVIE